MSMKIIAPWPGEKVTMVLPSPKFEDSKSPEQSVDVGRTMDGGTFTYVKDSNRQTIILPMLLARMKALELQEFVRVYFRAPLKIILHDGSEWTGTFISNPFAQSTVDRADGWPGGEAVALKIEISATVYHPPLF